MTTNPRAGLIYSPIGSPGGMHVTIRAMNPLRWCGSICTMLTSNQATFETTALLGDSRPASQSSSLTRKRFRFSPETLLIPVALATSLGAGIPSTTFIELLRKAICRLWNTSHGDPSFLPASDPSPPELCDAPEIAQYFATVLAILGVTGGIISIAGCGILSRISSHYGRKPAFVLVLLARITGSCMIPGSQFMPYWLTNWVLLAGMLFEMFSGSLGYLINMYIVDKCAPEDRTAALSKIAGWAGLGVCVSFSLGGTITTKTGNPLIVFYMAAAIYVATFIYVVSVLPESFPEEKRTALSHMCLEPSTDGLPAATRSASLLIFEPLKILMPTRRLDGTRNRRLAWCATHTFVFITAGAYTSAAWMVLATTKYHLTPADTGLFLTVTAISSTIVLAVIVPQLIRFLRRYYRREIVRSLLTEEDMINGEEVELETSDHLHVHLAFVSCVISAIVFVGAAVSTTTRALIFCGIWIGFTSIHGPTIRSLVVGSVDPLKQGEALAAIEMVSSAGHVLSPIIMGSILTATIGTTPLLLFYVHMVVVLISGALLFLVRDADRYQKPREE